MTDKQKAVIKAIDDANALELLASLALSLDAVEKNIELCNETGLLIRVNATKARLVSDIKFLSYLVDRHIKQIETADKFDGAGVA